MSKQSLTSYRQIYASLPHERAKLYAYVFHSKEVTISQYANFVGKGKNSVSGRFTELHHAGLLEVIGERGNESVYAVSQVDTYSPLEFKKQQLLKDKERLEKRLDNINKQLGALC